MTSSKYHPPPKTCFSPLGNLSHMVVHSRYWCRGNEDLRKATLICLPHVYTLPLEAFSHFERKNGQGICARTPRIDEGSYRRLIKRLNYDKIPAQDYESDVELQEATERRNVKEQGELSRLVAPRLIFGTFGGEFPSLDKVAPESKPSQVVNQDSQTGMCPKMPKYA